MSQDPLTVVRGYHERTKHHLNRPARSLGYMDWANQPDPFRRYAGTELIPLDHPPMAEEPRFDQLGDPSSIPPAPIDRSTVSQLFYDSLALSAWKQAGTSRWALRVNPSSGNLHPTEGYLIAGPIDGLAQAPGVFHYAPREHGLELRRPLSETDWQTLTDGLPPGAVLVALTSIYWREAWKYGERAFRYCQHDVGHAVGAIAYAAAALGWRVRLLESAGDEDLAVLLGVHEQSGPDAEHPDCLLAVYPHDASFDTAEQADFAIASGLRAAMEQTPARGEPNALSREHTPWPIIDAVSSATCRSDGTDAPLFSSWHSEARNPSAQLPIRPLSARRIIRSRRSAVDMDGTTHIARDTFYRMMLRTCPRGSDAPFSTLPWTPAIHLAIFVHRVDDLTPGLYLLARRAEQMGKLRSAVRGEGDFLWHKPPECPADLELYELVHADARNAARVVSCQQNIASDGAFAIGMLAEFDDRLAEIGPWFYKRLFWETGIIGQTLYLEAEAAGIRGTGIGCFFDDSMHELLGLADRQYQSLYHFTIGGPVDDPRLKTLAPYSHLGDTT